MSAEFREAFERAFYEPEKHVWRSERGRWLWIELQVPMDRIAGPLFSVATTGGCEYVYTRDDFAVANPDGLSVLLRDWHTALTNEIEAFHPVSAHEQADQMFARICSDQIWAVTQAGLEIERMRWGVQRKKLN